MLAVVLALPALVVRVSAERRSPTVDIAVADSAVYDDASRQDVQAQQAVLARLTGAGVGSVVVGMESIRRYVESGDVTVVGGREPAGAGAGADALPPGFASSGDPGAATAASAAVLRGRPGDPQGRFARIVDVLRHQFGERVTTTSVSSPRGRVPFVRVAGVRDLADVSLGYDPSRLRTLAAADVRVVLALPARIAAGRSWLEAEVRRAVQATGARTVLALGPLPFGGGASGAGEREAFGTFLASHGLSLALPDLARLRGAVAYGRQASGRVVRAHLVSLAPGDDRAALEVRARRAEKERGVRLVVLRSRSESLVPRESVDLVARLAPGLVRDLPGSLRTGAPSALPAVEPGIVARAAVLVAGLVVLGCFGGWLVGTAVPVPRVRIRVRRTVPGGRRPTTVDVAWWRVPRWLAGAGVGVAGLAGVAALVADNLLLWQLLTLTVAAAGATLAVLAAFGRRGRRRLVGGYLLGVGVATATGLVVAAFGSRSVFVTGLVPFLGVKALLLAPPALVALLGVWSYLSAPDIRSGDGPTDHAPAAVRPRRLRQLARSVRPVHVLGAVVVFAVAAFYLVRSGNSGIAPGFELWLRDGLDEALYVRPRFKEALLGLPALVVALAWSGVGRWACAVVAAVGTASVVDTFAHFHTPVGVGLLRTAYAVVIGLLLGLVATWILGRVDGGPVPGRRAGADAGAGADTDAGPEPRSVEVTG